MSDRRNNGSRPIVSDYIRARLERAGLERDYQPVGQPCGRTERAMRQIGEEFENRYREVFRGMCAQLHVTPENAQGTFTVIVQELFQDGCIKWGRIVALFAFAGCLAVECVQKEMPTLVEQVIDWMSNYIDAQLLPWIEEHGGWDAFVVFCESCPERSESPWPSIKTLCSYAVGAIGVLTLGAILVQKS